MRRFVVLLAAAGMVLSCAASAAAPAVAANSGLQTVQRIILRGSLKLPASQLAGGAGSGAPRAMIDKRTVALPAAGLRTAAGAAADHPSPIVSGQLPGFLGIRGLTNYDQVNAGSGVYKDSQYTLEPPDQGLCVGGGYAIEVINTALRVYTTGGHAVTRPIALNQFYGLAPEETSTTPPIFGPSIGDPRCYFDPATHRWFFSVYDQSVDPSTGDLLPNTSVLLAVSRSSNPRGAWREYQINATDDGTGGTPSHPGCPCFPDQPLIGADANGFYVTTNEYGVVGTGYNGAQMYAMSKRGLENGSIVSVVHINAAQMTVSLPHGGLAVSIQPAESPTAGSWQRATHGTEYFMSVTDWSVGPALGQGAHRILAWALTHTASLDAKTPSVHLGFRVLRSEFYTQPPNATQKNGPRPLGQSLHDPLEVLNTDDDRMNQVVYAAGRLWSGLNTAVTDGGAPRAGIAYFVVRPTSGGGTFAPSIAAQGYLAAHGANIMYPAIGVSAGGRAVMAFSLSGPRYFPSAAYAPWRNGRFGPVYIAGAGKLPEDGFTGYKQFKYTPGIGRWGDYSAAVADSAGNIWMGAEMIPKAPRTTYANWGTFIWKVRG
jgi:hypothetical protein